MIICPKPKTLYYKILQDTILWYLFTLIVLNFVMSILLRKKKSKSGGIKVLYILKHRSYDM